MRACVLRLACEPPNVPEAVHIPGVLGKLRLDGRAGAAGERQAGGRRGPSHPAGWLTLISNPKVSSQQHNVRFPGILNDGRIGIQTNPTARGFRHLVLPRHQAGGCLQKGWPQNVTEIPV